MNFSLTRPGFTRPGFTRPGFTLPGFTPQPSRLASAQETSVGTADSTRQRLRHGERLGVVFNIDDQPWALLACPPLLFQPLLENAIQHALEVQRGPCTVQIRLRLENGIIIFEVRNPLFPKSRPSKGHGVGLASIRTRLATLFAQDASLETGPNAASGCFVACLRYPAVPMETSMPTPTQGPAIPPLLGA